MKLLSEVLTDNWICEDQFLTLFTPEKTDIVIYSKQNFLKIIVKGIPAKKDNPASVIVSLNAAAPLGSKYHQDEQLAKAVISEFDNDTVMNQISAFISIEPKIVEIIGKETVERKT